jgi:hypothetical protein
VVTIVYVHHFGHWVFGIMRDPKRIKPLCDQLCATWSHYPDWRFGQFLSNFLGWVLSNKDCHDIFFPEDDKWLKWLKEYAE